MNAVLLAKHTANTAGLPDEWPVETRALSDGETAALPWLTMSDGELSAHVAAHAGEKEAWNLAREAPSPVTQSVTPRQIRRALNDAGLRATVDAAIAAADQATRDDWEFALEIRRDWPALAGMAAALGLTGAQVDALFTQAATY